jgi:hypothetical protein
MRGVAATPAGRPWYPSHSGYVHAATREVILNHIILYRSRFLTAAFIVATLLLGSPPTSAQGQKTQISFQVSAANTKYTQRLTVDVGDYPGHTVTLYEIHRTFPANAPQFAGQSVKDSWSRGTADIASGNGPVGGYVVFNLESGDKVFGTFSGTEQSMASSDRRAVTGNVALTGGTGKLRGIRGNLHVSLISDAKGFNEAKYDGEYWLEQ